MPHALLLLSMCVLDVSERFKKGDQIVLFLVRKPDAEALVIEIHDVIESRCGSVMKIRRACSQSAQDWTFHFADIGTMAADECPARIGDPENLALEGTT